MNQKKRVEVAPGIYRDWDDATRDWWLGMGFAEAWMMTSREDVNVLVYGGNRWENGRTSRACVHFIIEWKNEPHHA